MKIAVVAASGRSGKAFVEKALAAGLQIRAGVHRQTNDLFAANPNLEVIVCDATNYEQVVQLMHGCDAVVCLIGHGHHSPADVQTISIKNILSAMAASGIGRVVSLTGTGVRFPGDKITLIDRILNLSIKIIDPKRISDGQNHVDILRSSQTDWTIIRVLKLQNTKFRKFSLSNNGPTKIVTSRAEVAQAIIKVLTNHSFIQAAPIISPEIK